MIKEYTQLPFWHGKEVEQMSKPELINALTECYGLYCKANQRINDYIILLADKMLEISKAHKEE